MISRSLNSAIVAVCGVASYVALDIRADETRPNVVLIMTDDQGYGDFGATGNRVIQTPNLDRMARGSGSMSHFYVCPVCSPTRASLMTGRYNYRTRCIDTWLGRSMMEPEEVTLAEVLREAGYATGIFGKWHLGDCYPTRAIDQGFQESLIHKGGGLAQPSEPRENDRRYTDAILFHNGLPVQSRGYCTDVYFDAARRFIRESAAQDENFFVYIPTNAPHGPFHDVPETLYRDYLKKKDALASLLINPDNRERQVDQLARIAAMITNVDQNIGRLFSDLDSLDLTANTLVIFMNDNGPNGRRYAGPFRGSKTGVHEGGIRSPFWLHWPAGVEPGSTSDALAAHIDVMPTILDACGVSLPQNVKLDGRSFLPLLTGSSTTWPERTIAIQSHRGNQPVRYHHFMVTDGSWKLLHPSGFGRESFEGDPQFELYHIESDPGETRNRVQSDRAVFRRLKRAYDNWFNDVSSTRPDNYAPPRIHIGTPHERETHLTRQDWRDGSWQRDSTGHWKLQVAIAGRYDLEFLFDPAADDEQLSFSTDRRTHSVRLSDDLDRVTIPEVRLSRGPWKLSPTITDGERVRGVYQVIVRRSP